MTDPSSAPHNACNSQTALAAIEFAITDLEGLQFLRSWHAGDFDSLRKDWPNAPESAYIGVDPLHPKSPSTLPAGSGQEPPLLGVVLSAQQAVERATTAVGQWQREIQFKNEDPPQGAARLSALEGNLHEALRTLTWVHAQLTGSTPVATEELNTSLKASYANVVRAEMHLLDWEVSNPQHWRKYHDVAVTSLGQAIGTLAAIRRPMAEALRESNPTVVEPAGWREFLENIAKPRSEPLNSVCVYRDKDSRNDMAALLRQRARELLASAEAPAPVPRVPDVSVMVFGKSDAQRQADPVILECNLPEGQYDLYVEGRGHTDGAA